MYKYIQYILICSQLLIINFQAQNNIIPNSGFQQPNSITNCPQGNDFNESVNNWKIDMPPRFSANWKDPGTALITFSNCAANSKNCSFWRNKSLKVLRLTTRIMRNCNKLRKDNVGVALENNANFAPYTTYKIRYKIFNAGGDSPLSGYNNSCEWTRNWCHIRFFASDNGPLTWLNNNNNKEEIISANYSGGYQSMCAFKLIERNFSLNSGNYTTLALLAESGGFFIDDVEIFPQCDNNYIIQNKTYNYTIYAANAVEGQNFKEEAGATLIAGNNVGGNTGIGDVVVEILTYVNYTASSEILLKDGFTVEHGADFNAKILPCPNNFNRSMNDLNTNPDPNYVIPPPLLSDEEAANEEVENEGATNISISPNPNNGQFYIQLSEEEELPISISIQNILGQVVLNMDVTSNNTKVDLSEAPKGIYMVLINYKEYTATKKIIKQ